MAETWLRVATYTLDAPGDREALDYMETSIKGIVHTLERQPGFRSGQWGYDPVRGTAAAVTHWRSREDIEGAASQFKAFASDRSAHGLTTTGATNLRLFTTPIAWDQADWAAITGRNAATWLRVVLYKPVRRTDQACVEYLESSTRAAVELLKRQDGFRTGYWGHDPVTGAMAAVTYWESQQAIEGASGELERLQQERQQNGVETEAIANLQLFRSPVMADQAPRGWM